MPQAQQERSYFKGSVLKYAYGTSQQNDYTF